jgi:23S rRNA pseudouridine1911/1915/1917 synthase
MDQRFFLSWEIGEKEAGMAIKDFLHEQDISRTALTDIKFKGGNIFINGEDVNVRYRLKTGDRLKIVFPLEQPSEGISPEDIPLSIVYEDSYVMVVNKPGGMNSIPSREHPSGSLANALLGYYEKVGISSTAHIVTRLDRDTSGLVLIAKYRHVHHLLSQEQKKGTVNRTYVAFVSGTIKEDTGVIEEPIARKADSIIEREVNPNGQYACTKYKVLNRKDHCTHVELKLETGRTHQIRVHLSHLGHPLLGDDLYGGDTKLISRQALHCREVSFFHPFLKKEFRFQAPLPGDMQRLQEILFGENN